MSYTDMCDYKSMIERCIKKYYFSLEDISGEDLHELGEWVDIIKDLAEMRYYEAKAKKNELLIKQMSDGEISPDAMM